MFNYLRAEIYRLLRKKSLYLFLAIVAVGYLAIAFARSGDLGADSIMKDANVLFMLLPPVIGGALFAAIYTDDLSSKNLSTLVGFGLAKAKIVVAKSILGLLFAALIFGLVPLFMYLFYAALGWPTSGETMIGIYQLLLKHFLLAVTFMSISGIVAYGVQRSTVAIVTYVVLGMGMVGQLLTMLLDKTLPDASPHLPSNLADHLYTNLATGDGAVVSLGAELLAYVVISIIAAVMLFNKKEMEF
jgi:ABC-type transport system involved in multi-copper enzyme maturation permease subunit